LDKQDKHPDLYCLPDLAGNKIIPVKFLKPLLSQLIHDGLPVVDKSFR